ncbi:hypothetical protein F443_19329 [Phytophthora nicotianae P1569]|uniref:Uncharacterized protein n=1 Tax=Phytophthora nicotianae P1569 TaxID=1317065 RepID=V9E728_PHYNI|nr:hypothetical protein F443_19329 [Phytophthora nicotianae P1569]
MEVQRKSYSIWQLRHTYIDSANIFNRTLLKLSVAFDTELRLPLPDALSCRPTLKNREPLQGCHDKCLPSPPFADKVVEGYRVLSAKVEEHFSSKLPGQQRTKFDNYVKQSNNAKQKQFGVICQECMALQSDDTHFHAPEDVALFVPRYLHHFREDKETFVLYMVHVRGFHG